MWSWGEIRDMARQADLQELAQTVFVAIVFAFMLSKLFSMFMAIRSSMRAGDMRVELLSPIEEAQEERGLGDASSSDEMGESIHSVDSEGDKADVSGLSEGRADFSEVSESGGFDEASGTGIGSPAPIIKKDETAEQEAITGQQSLAPVEAGYEPSTSMSSSLEAEAGSNRSVSAVAVDDEDDSSDWEGVESTELDEAFGAASSFIATQAGGLKVSSETQLQLYGLYKVATEGPCHTAQPSALKMAARAKWNAWQKLGNISQDEAMERYVELVSELSPDWASNKKSKGAEGSKPKKGPVGPVFSTLAHEEKSDDGSLGALHIAAREGNEPSVLEVLSQGVPVDVQDSDGRTALHWASDRGHLGLVELLLSRGANLQAKDKEGQTALHYACVCEQEMVAKFLTSKGADPQARDTEGSTPLNFRPANWDWMNE